MMKKIVFLLGLVFTLSGAKCLRPAHYYREFQGDSCEGLVNLKGIHTDVVSVTDVEVTRDATEFTVNAISRAGRNVVVPMVLTKDEKICKGRVVARVGGGYIDQGSKEVFTEVKNVIGEFDQQFQEKTGTKFVRDDWSICPNSNCNYSK
ncbi:hypothetical protein ACLVWU_08730 [Bdellovibrio sp. HCB290]|uniref:hypothetical protein n=1 Tax=Bdellovibrio sp. HCB290 TaxID=3394356 RepID=UPI0039B66B69